MSVRYNAEVEQPGEDPETMNYLTLTEVVALAGAMKEGDALVLNAVAGPGAGEI